MLYCPYLLVLFSITLLFAASGNHIKCESSIVDSNRNGNRKRNASENKVEECIFYERQSKNDYESRKSLINRKGFFLEKRATKMSKPVSAAISSMITHESSISFIASDRSSNLVANALGYLMGLGSIALYSPIIIDLLKKKSADGYSTQTWIFSIFGLLCSILYPFKKGFPISTYLELIAVSIQNVGILGLVSLYKGKLREYFVAMMLATTAVYFTFTATISSEILSYILTLSIISCNYALIPQIYLTFQTKKPTWNPITSFLSMSGCLVRIFTTVQLTQDKLTLVGYIVGFLQNLTILLQFFFYRNN